MYRKLRLPPSKDELLWVCFSIIYLAPLTASSRIVPHELVGYKRAIAHEQKYSQVSTPRSVTKDVKKICT